MDKFLGFKTEEILTCLLLVVVGYFIAKMFSRSCANRVDGFSVGIQDIYQGGPCTPGVRECSPINTDKDYKYNCPDNGKCDFVTRKCGPRLHNCQDTATSTCKNDGHLCRNDCIAPEGGINDIWNGTDGGGRKGGWCKVSTPTPPAPAPTPTPPPVDESCTYSGDIEYNSDTNPDHNSLNDFYTRILDNGRGICDDNVRQSCEMAYSKHFDDKYEGYCLQTQGDEDGRGDCPLDLDGKPAAWLINNVNSKDVEYAKNACKSRNSEDGVNKGDFAWVTEKGGIGSCKKCGNSPPPPGPSPPGPSPSDICKGIDTDLAYGGINTGEVYGDCPKQKDGQTCCYYATEHDNNFYNFYSGETTDMKTKCENEGGTFTGPTSNDDVRKLEFPDLTGQKNKFDENIDGNELFCYYNHTNDPEHLNDHIKYCGDNPKYESGHGYFCSFPSNKKHGHNRRNLSGLRHERNRLRDQLSQLQAQSNGNLFA